MSRAPRITCSVCNTLYYGDLKAPNCPVCAQGKYQKPHKKRNRDNFSWPYFCRSDPLEGLPPGMRAKQYRTQVWERNEEWASVVRRDICSYCQGPGGTVDHIEPISAKHRSKKQKKWQELHGPYWDSWINRVGACSNCNQAKKSQPLLFYLLSNYYYWELWGDGELLKTHYEYNGAVMHKTNLEAHRPGAYCIVTKTHSPLI